MDEAQELAPSEHAMRVELQAQVGRLESVIAVLKQQVKALERDQSESLGHIRTVCRQRDEARDQADQYKMRHEAAQAALEKVVAERDGANNTASARIKQLVALRDLCPRKLTTMYPFDVIAHRLTRFNQQEAGRNREAAKLRKALAASQAEVARWSVLANDHQDAVVEARALLAERTRERDALKVRLAEEDPAINEEIRTLLEVVRPGVANVLAQELAATINRDTSRNNGERAVALATALVAILDGDKFAAEKIAVLCAIVRTLGVALVEHRKRN